jgi:outer membrane lipoprotein SlyB
MNILRILATAAFATAIAVTAVPAQQQTQRLRGTIEKVDGNTLLIRSSSGEAALTLADNTVVVGVAKAGIEDIKEGSYIGSGALPQPDGTQKAVEVHIFAESQRGTGDGHRTNWDGAPGGTMTNGAVGQTVSSVDGPVITVKYKDGEKKVVVGPDVPIVRYEIANRSELKPGAAVSVLAATKKPDGTFTTGRINVGRDGVVPR